MTNKESKTQDRISHKPLVGERPITSGKQDTLGRTSFIRRLTETLIDASTNKARGVVIGITGPWGSGKSSALNLLNEQIVEKYPDAVIVQFDAWLISGRNDLISEFMEQLRAAVDKKSKTVRGLKKFGKAVAEYGAQLAPLAKAIPIAARAVPGGDIAAKVVLSGAAALLAKNETIQEAKLKLTAELGAIEVPVIVLIDELDRVEDGEIRVTAQLIRSVADFPNVSYVLAFDRERVVDALSTNKEPQTGQAYLDKIIQLQIPLPLVSPDEVAELLNKEIGRIANDLSIPSSFREMPRYQELAKIILGSVITTPRDVKRLIETYSAIAGMVRGEVDWTDLLGYAILLIKAPEVIEYLRRDPEAYVQDAITISAQRMQEEMERVPLSDRLDRMVQKSDFQSDIKMLLAFLFPALSERSPGQKMYAKYERRDAIHLRRPLLSVLRLGLIPGGYSKSEAIKLLAKQRQEIVDAFQASFDQNRLTNLVNRVEDLSSELSADELASFLLGGCEFLKNRNFVLTEIRPLDALSRSLHKLLEDSVIQGLISPNQAIAIVDELKSGNDVDVYPHILKEHIYQHSLFNVSGRLGKAAFLAAPETSNLAKNACAQWRSLHIVGALLPKLRNLVPMYLMDTVGVWDADCRKALEFTLASDPSQLDAFIIMSFGEGYTSDSSSIERLCSFDHLKTLAEERIEDKTPNGPSPIAIRSLLALVKGYYM